MNKIYRTVYNETTGTWVAVCETAKTHTKSSGKSSVVKAVAAVSMAAVAGVAMAGSVVATNTEPVSVTGSDSTTAQRLKLEAMVAAFNSLGGTLTENADGSYSHNGTLVINADGTLTAIGQTRIPHKVKTDALSQLAVGDNAHSNKGGAVAVGSNAYAGGYQSVAVGMGASANGGGAVAIGGGLSNGTLQGAVANGNGAISLGVNALAQGDNAFAAAGGHAQSNNTISIGVRSIADGEGAIAFGSGINQGNNAGSYAKGEGSIAIGKRAEAVRATVQYDGEKGNYTLPQNVTTDPHGHQYTYNRTVIQDSGSGAQIIAIGDNASAYGNQSIALGGNSVATGYASVAIGGDDIGSATNNREIINYLTGTLATELSTGGFDTPTAITNLSSGQYYVNLTTSKGDVSTAFGIKAVSEGNLSNAYGVAARSVGLNSNAFGTTSFAGGDESIAFGTASKTAIGADKATVVGYMSQIGENGDNSVAFGAKNKVTETNSAAIGQNNTVGTANTFVLGNNVGNAKDKTIANSVYLGAGSTTATTKGGAGLKQVQNATVGGITYGDFAGQNAQGIVSVGTDSSARRIQNVAAGAINADSTDAINGSQLYAVLPQYTTDPTTNNVTSVQVGNQTYNFAQGGAADGNDITELTVNDYQAAGNTTGNLKLTDQGSGDSHNYNVALNNTVELGDNTADGSLTVGNQKGDSKTEINPNSINFTNQNGGSITNVASHLKDQAPTDTAMNDANNPSNFGNMKNEAATVGDVLNAGWGLKANGNAVDFVAHGDTVNFTSNDQSITITPKVTDGKDSVLDLSANVTFYADEAATQEAQATDKAKSVKVGNKTYQLGGDTYNVTGPNTPVTVVGTGSVKVEDTSGNGAEYTVSIPVVANSGGNAATAANVANSSTGSVAVGENANIGNNVANSIAIGKEAKVERDGNNNIVIGSGSTISENGQNITVIGNNITASSSSKNAVVIGTGSTLGEVNSNSVYAGGDGDNAAGSEFAFRKADAEYNNKDKFATFSVGSGSLKRQIQNVAAGKVQKDSTDAVNGDQLYSVAVAVANTGNSLAGGGKVNSDGSITGGTGVLGESFTVNTDDSYGKIGTIIGKNIAGTGADNIEDAIKQSRTEVTAKTGDTYVPITVTPTTNNGKTTYEIAIDKTKPETVITDPADSNVGKVVITSGDENKIVTAGDLATAINSSGWVASDSTNNAFVATGDTVTIKGKNGVKVGLDAKTQTFTVESDYVFKDKDGNVITDNGDVATIETTDDKGNTVTYNIGGGDGNDVTSLTAQGENANSTTGNLKLTDKGTGDSHQYDIALNNDVKLGDDKGNSGSLNVNNGTGGSTNIEGNKITFGDTTTPNSGSIDGLAQHFTKTGDTTAPSETADTTSGKADNQAATVGDVRNVGWNLKVGNTVQDFVNHGDTVAFADGTGTKAKYDNATGAISFDIAKAGDSKVDTTVTNADAGKVTGGTGDEYWDSKQVQNAINNAGWKAGTGATANAKDELINAGDRVGLVAGQGVKVTQDGSNFTFATDYVFKDGKGDDITNKGGDVATITTKDDKGNDVTYNFGDGNDNTVTAVTVNGGQDATANQADGGNLKLTETKDANGNPTYDIALNDEVDLTDKGSLKVGGDDIANGSPVTNITAGNIDFGDTQGSITNVASHLKDPASKDDKGQVINPDNAPANFNSVKNEAATVGDVLNAGWNLKVGGQDADFVQHGDTVAFGNSDTVSAAYDSGVIKFNANTTPLTVNNTTGVVNAPANNNALVTAGDVQTAINNAGWFVSSQGRAGAANPVLVNAGNEVKFIAGDGMDIVQNGKELTFNAKIVDTNGNQLKLDQDGNYVVGIVDPSGNPVTVNSDGEFVVGGGSSSGGGRPFVITADDGTGNQSTTTIDGVAKTEGSGVTFVGDENVKVIKQPTQGGDGTDVVVGLQNKVNVGGTSDGTSGGQPNAGSVTIDGSNQNGGSITFNNTNPDNSVKVNGDSGSLNLGQGANNNPVNITNVNKGADGSNDAVNVAQIEDVVGAANKDANGVVKTTGTNGEEYTLKTYNVQEQQTYLTNNVVEAISKMNEQGIQFFHTNADENGNVNPAWDGSIDDNDSSAKGGWATAIGVNAKANGKQSISVGNESEANGVQSIAVGTQVVVNGDHSGGIGDPTIIDGSNSYSVGNMNSVSTNNTFVLGNEVTNTADNSVFLGDKSAANAKGAGATGTVNNATVGGISYSGFAGETSVGMVAVGNDTQVRRVSGVAAGEISATSTDAINGSQLYAVLPDYVGSDGINVVMDDNGAGRKKVTISTVPGYAEGIEAGNNVVFNYKPVYETDAGGVTTDPDKAKKDANGDPVAKMITDKNGNQVQQQTTVINAKQPDLTPVNNRIDQVQNQVQQVENNAYAGVAQAMATAGLPQAYLPGKSMVAIAGGHYKGEQGYAVGVSSISDSGNWVFKATASGNTRGNVGGTIGAGYQW